uniref:SH3 domain-containing protein n=1 Tax=Anser cygnoides TaxID=8845 RepID=A0A8B9E7L9_ANSCY
MESAGAPEEVYVLVEYGFEYRAKDGTLVSIKPNERYVLLKRTNDHWWHVRKSRDARPFYIPAQYVKELPPIASPAPLYHEEPEPEPEPPAAYEYRFIGTAPTARGDLPPTLSSFRAAPAPSPHPAEPMRPTQSLDDLARATPVPHGATTMGPHGDPPARPRPLSKSRSETLCVPRHRASMPSQCGSAEWGASESLCLLQALFWGKKRQKGVNREVQQLLPRGAGVSPAGSTQQGGGCWVHPGARRAGTPAPQNRLSPHSSK